MPGAADAASDRQVSALARAILDRPRYRDMRVEQFDLFDVLGEKWRALLDWLDRLRDTEPLSYWGLTVLMCALCLSIIAHVVWTLRATPRVRHASPPAAARSPEHDLARAAHELARRGQRLEAAHQLLLASLRVLARDRWIQLQPADGNRAVCRQIAASPLPERLRAQLIQLIADTERAWFATPARSARDRGSDPADAEDARRVPFEGEAALYRRWATAHAELLRVPPP